MIYVKKIKNLLAVLYLVCIGTIFQTVAAFCYGMVSYFFYFMGVMLSDFFRIVIIAPFTEEVIKLLVVMFLLKNRNFFALAIIGASWGVAELLFKYMHTPPSGGSFIHYFWMFLPVLAPVVMHYYTLQSYRLVSSYKICFLIAFLTHVIFNLFVYTWFYIITLNLRMAAYYKIGLSAAISISIVIIIHRILRQHFQNRSDITTTGVAPQTSK